MDSGFGVETLERLDVLDLSNEDMLQTVIGRCNGLVEAIGDKYLPNEAAEARRYVGFMHRSIPEFLHQHFLERRNDLGLDDYRLSQTLAWVYLVDLRCDYIVQSARSGQNKLSSLAESLNSKLIRDVPRKVDLPAFLDLHHLDHLGPPPGWDRVFDILLAIDGVLNQLGSSRVDNWRFHYKHIPILQYVIDQRRSLVHLAAYYGMHQFIDWFLQRSDSYPEAGDNRRDLVIYGIASSAIAAFHWQPNTLRYQRARKTLEVLFNHEPAQMAKMVFPPETPLAGSPLWHGFLLHACPFNKNPTGAQALELWLRHGANPHIGLMADPRVGFIVEVYDRRDGSGHLERDDITLSDNREDPEMKLIGESFTLRRFVELSEIANKQTLLQLIGEDLVDDVAEGPAPKLQHAE